VTEIFGPALPEDDWEKLRKSAKRLLAVRGHENASIALDRFPFELRSGTNYFHDEFCVLETIVPLEDYIQLEELKATSSRDFKLIAETLSEIGPYTRFVVAALDTDEGPVPVPPPSPTVTSESVERALADAEQLLKTQGPVSAVDRAHTALHGYLRIVLDQAQIPIREDASVTELFKLLRESHPTLQAMGARREDLWRIITGMAAIIDALNTLRNKASVAHPTETLLRDAEAMLAINAARTLLHYLDERIKG